MNTKFVDAKKDDHLVVHIKDTGHDKNKEYGYLTSIKRQDKTLKTLKKKKEKDDYGKKQFDNGLFHHPQVLAPHELAFTLLSGLHDAEEDVLKGERPSQAISELNGLLLAASKLERKIKWKRKWKKVYRMDQALSSFQISETEKYEVRNWV